MCVACPSSMSINQEIPEGEEVRMMLGPQHRKFILNLRQMIDPPEEEGALAAEGAVLAGGELREIAGLGLQPPIVLFPRDNKVKEVVQELRPSLDEVAEGENKMLLIQAGLEVGLLLTADHLIIPLFPRTPRDRKMQQVPLPVLEKDKTLQVMI